MWLEDIFVKKGSYLCFCVPIKKIPKVLMSTTPTLIKLYHQANGNAYGHIFIYKQNWTKVTMLILVHISNQAWYLYTYQSKANQPVKPN